MEKTLWKPGTLLAPVPPALVSCGTLEKPNALTVAWTGILCSDPAKTYISLRPTRYSYELIRESGEFVINLPTVHIARAVDFCGVHSGRDKDKLALCKLTVSPSETVSAPAIAESPVSIECRVEQIIPLGSHDMFIAAITGVQVASELVDKKGKLHLEKAGLVCYAHGDYFALGQHMGSFGFSVRKKHRHARKKPEKNA